LGSIRRVGRGASGDLSGEIERRSMTWGGPGSGGVKGQVGMGWVLRGGESSVVGGVGGARRVAGGVGRKVDARWGKTEGCPAMISRYVSEEV